MDSKSVILVLVGITGDLAKRKLLPALANLLSEGRLPEQFKLVGITRQSMVDPKSLLSGISDSGAVKNERADDLLKHLELFSMDVHERRDYTRLSQRLEEIEKDFKGDGAIPTQRLFYLSIPPDGSQRVIEMLGKSGLAKTADAKLLIEKPFGSDLDSAKDLLAHVQNYFEPKQIYLIDHYLSKEMVRDFVAWKDRTEEYFTYWNRKHVTGIEILASEKIGIENRANFYEQTGALRDLVQSHLLQLAAVTLIQPSPYTSSTTETLPNRRLEALKHLRIPEGHAASHNDTPKGTRTLESAVTLGQYEGYRQEVENSKSMTETYVSLVLESTDPRWQGVPITITTGKALDKKRTEIRVQYRDDRLVRESPSAVSDSVLAEDLVIFDHPSDPAEAYEKVFLDAIQGEQGFFVSPPEVLECWRIIMPVLDLTMQLKKKLISSSSKIPDQLCIYKRGSSPF